MEPTALHVWFDYEDVRCGARTRNPHREDQKLNPLPHATGVASVAQLGERQTEDLKVPGSIPGRGTFARVSGRLVAFFALFSTFFHVFPHLSCLHSSISHQDRAGVDLSLAART
ncbi:unnamed protein product [Peronospora farinosa]|uniref:Uncharacterized protein n=1 Tax=Peronospora farinosa TaxID=134698 RepID=A0AAV0TND6_9STRA|nr:unnamed protein product [Peronospora farinosa]